MRTCLLVVILLATASCGAYRFPGIENGSGTVSGRVMATPCGPIAQPAAPVCVPCGPMAQQTAPVCFPCGPIAQKSIPVCVPCGSTGPSDQMCPPGPAFNCLPDRPNWTGCGTWPMPGVQLVFTNGGVSRSAQTDSNGAYSIELPAGTWTVDAKPYVRIISGPRTLVVNAGATVVANYLVDTGIRAASQPGSAAGAPTRIDGGAQFPATGH